MRKEGMRQRAAAAASKTGSLGELQLTFDIYTKGASSGMGVGERQLEELGLKEYLPIVGKWGGWKKGMKVFKGGVRLGVPGRISNNHFGGNTRVASIKKDALSLGRR